MRIDNRKQVVKASRKVKLTAFFISALLSASGIYGVEHYNEIKQAAKNAIISASTYSAESKKSNISETITDEKEDIILAEKLNNDNSTEEVKENTEVSEDTIKFEIEVVETPSVDSVEEKVEYSFPETYENVVNYHKTTDLLDDGYTDLLFDLDSVQEQYGNEDITSWVVIPNTDVSEPIAQKTSKDKEDYYLHHSLEGKETKAGTIYQDYRDSSFTDSFDNLSDISYTYGHHMKNGKMYAPVDNYKNQSFYDNHQYGILYTPQDTYKLEVFASNVYDAKDYDNVYSYDFNDEDTFNAFIDYVNEYSLIKTDIDVQYGDKIFVFVTCDYDGTPVNLIDGKEKRLYVYAKMVPQYTNYYDIESNKSLTLK